MRLVRSNDDPKLIADLERLSGAESVAPVTPPEVLEDDLRRLAATSSSRPDLPIDDPFVTRFVQASVHFRKYAPFYAGAFLWLGAMLLIDPVGGNRTVPVSSEVAGSRRVVAAPASSSSATTSEVDVDVAGAPVFDSFGGSAFDSADTSEFADFGSTEDEPPPSDEFAFEEDSFDTEEFESFESFEDEAEEEEAPDPLDIIESGYASTTGGTLLEQQPSGGGLPITAAGGSMTKFSFIRLTGDETVLNMQESPDGNVNSATATLKACPISDPSWTGGPGKPVAAAPKYDEEYCAAGTRSAAGVWTFDLMDFAPIEGSNGFAILPGSGTASTFQVVLKPSAIPSDPPAEE